MNERMKVLELLEEGKITAAQAAELLAAMDNRPEEEKNKREFPFPWTFPRKSNEEWKAMTNQIKSAVQQHLDEWKKSVDIEEWSFRPASRISTTISRTLPEATTHVTVETKQGRIHVSRSDGPAIRVQVRSSVKAESAEEARQLLDAAIQTSELGGRSELTFQPTRETGDPTIEVYLPESCQSVRLISHNGAVRTEHLRLSDLTVDVHNGNIVAYQTGAARMRLLAHNGNIDMQHSILAESSSVYATTHHGTIDIDGIAAQVRLSGTAKSHHGRVEITGESLAVDYDHPQQRQHARFRNAGEADPAVEETQVYCETNNGLVIIRA